MKQSQLFTKTKREAPSDEEALNAKILVRAGFIHKEMAGVYDYLPLGLRVINKIEAIIREEMNQIGGMEMRTSVLQNKEVWEKSNRWSDEVVDNWFKTELKNGGEVGLSFTNEEAYSNLLKQYVSSYKDLPIYPYDFKNIFRNEVRSKSGIMRGKEFYWKALYSFSKDEREHQVFYEKAKTAYHNVFNRAGIGHLTYMTFASGGSFSKFSHEFQTITSVGEDTIYLDEASGIAINKEVYNDDVISELKLKKENLVEKKAVEVGNIFSLGIKFSTPFDLKYKDENGEEKMVVMGSYGIGLGRLMGTVVDVLAKNENEMVWPKSISPFSVHIIEIKGKDGDKIREGAEEVYRFLESKGVEVLYDDRDKTSGEKFADADLIGLPVRVIIGKNFLDKEMVEVVDRTTGEKTELSLSNLESIISIIK